jgi:hypothetical protein
MSTHIAEVCPQTALRCPLFLLKLCNKECNGLIKRHDSQTHITEQLSISLQQTTQSLTDKLLENETQNKELKTMNESLLKQVAKHNADMQLFRSKVEELSSEREKKRTEKFSKTLPSIARWREDWITSFDAVFNSKSTETTNKSAIQTNNKMCEKMVTIYSTNPFLRMIQNISNLFVFLFAVIPAAVIQKLIDFFPLVFNKYTFFTAVVAVVVMSLRHLLLVN